MAGYEAAAKIEHAPKVLNVWVLVLVRTSSSTIKLSVESKEVSFVGVSYKHSFSIGADSWVYAVCFLAHDTACPARVTGRIPLLSPSFALNAKR